MLQFLSLRLPVLTSRTVLASSIHRTRVVLAGCLGLLLGLGANDVWGDTLLLLCDQAVPEISAWDVSSKEPVRRWAWVPGKDSGIPDNRKKLFSHPTDAKTSRDGRQLLVCASGGGVGIVAMPERKMVWFAAPGGNPHSVAQLPDDSLVVASSHGNQITHYGAGPDRKEIARHTVEGAHGATWDEATKRLLVLGGLQLHMFELREGKLVDLEQVPLPVEEDAPNGARNGGHDLVPMVDEASFLVTDAHHVWRFTPTPSRDFELWKKLDKVKAISPGKGTTALVRATESWWTDEVRLLPEERVVRFPGARIYKARWWSEVGR